MFLFPQDPKQQTLFSFVESFVEDYAADKSKELFESGSSSETNTQVPSMVTKKMKDVKSESGSDARKRKPDCDAVETGSEITSAVEDSFDWFDGIADEDIIPADLQVNTSCSNGPGPSAKRYRW